MIFSRKQNSWGGYSHSASYAYVSTYPWVAELFSKWGAKYTSKN